MRRLRARCRDERVSRGALYEPTVYPPVFRRTVRVQKNARWFRGAGDAFPSRMVWREATGRVIRVVRRAGG